VWPAWPTTRASSPIIRSPPNSMPTWCKGRISPPTWSGGLARQKA
jgi:hypothetical protein